MDDAFLEKLSAYTDGELDQATAATVEAALQAEPRLRKQLAAFRALDTQTATLPVPQLEPSASRALWQGISGQLKKTTGSGEAELLHGNALAQALPPVPEVSADKWAKVWSTIRSRTQATPSSTQEQAVVPLDDSLSPIGLGAVSDRVADSRPAARRPRSLSLWIATGGMAIAATLMAALTIFLVRHTTTPVTPGVPTDVAEDAQEGAQVLDGRYFMMVKHISEPEEPNPAGMQVVCFFLKE